MNKINSVKTKDDFISQLITNETAFIAKINEQASKLIIICNDDSECDLLYDLIKKITKFETLMMVSQHVLACLNLLIRKRSNINCDAAYEISSFILDRKSKLFFLY